MINDRLRSNTTRSILQTVNQTRHSGEAVELELGRDIRLIERFGTVRRRGIDVRVGKLHHLVLLDSDHRHTLGIGIAETGSQETQVAYPAVNLPDIVAELIVEHTLHAQVVTRQLIRMPLNPVHMLGCAGDKIVVRLLAFVNLGKTLSHAVIEITAFTASSS